MPGTSGGRLYCFGNYSRGKVVYGEMEDFGFTNLAYQQVGWGCIYFVTTRSVYYSRNVQEALFQRRVGLPTDTLYTAAEAFTGPEDEKRTRILAAPFSSGEDDPSQVLSSTIGYYRSPEWQRRSSRSPSVNRGLSSLVSQPSEKGTF
jgi:hypothetical protein